MKFHPQQTKQGFSLVELLVVIGIFALLSGSLYGNYRRYNSRVSLDNLTHQIALLIREAQVYGISVSQTLNLFRGYGAHFSTASGEEKILILFSDGSPVNKYYDGSLVGACKDTLECIDKITIQSGDKIRAICANTTADPGLCQYPLRELHITFVRPNPEAIFRGIDLNGDPISDGIADAFTNTKVVIEGLDGTQKAVIVWLTGQVAIEHNVGAIGI